MRPRIAFRQPSGARPPPAMIDAMHLPELDYFMEHCAESFSMTLDELE